MSLQINEPFLQQLSRRDDPAKIDKELKINNKNGQSVKMHTQIFVLKGKV